MQTVGSVASIVAAIREDAAAEVERVEQSAAAEIGAIRSDEAKTQISIPDRDSRLSAARRDVDERAALQEWEGRREVIEQRETWIAHVVAAAREQWKPGRAQLDALILEARQNLGAEPSAITVAERDGGCVVTAGDIVFDNSFSARAKRLEAEWRKALCEVYRL